MTAPIAPKPVAPKRPTILDLHGEQRVDDYHWLRDRTDDEVLAYLEAENEYANAVMGTTEGLKTEIYEEIVGRIQETDESAPVRKGSYWYSQRTVEGLEHPIHLRRPDDSDHSGRRGPGAKEQVLLDENELAKATGYVALGAATIDASQQLLAYSVDVNGSEQYELRVRDLATGEDLDDVIPDTTYGVEWSADSTALYYILTDEVQRPYRLMRHRLGVPPSDDVLVYEETDQRFYLGVHKTRSEQFLVMSLASKATSEAWLLRAHDPEAKPQLVREREQGIEYSVEHQGDRLLILTNLGAAGQLAENFRLVEMPVPKVGDPVSDGVAKPSPSDSWRELIAPRDDVRLEDVEAFAEYLAIVERAEARTRVRVMRSDGSDDHIVEVPEEVSMVGVGANLEYDTRTIRLGYTSLTTPNTAYDYDIEARQLALIKRDPVLGGYDPQAYVTTRLWATASDGARIPISAVHRRDLPLDGSAPALLYGYGSYEACIDPYFSFARLSLLERGFVFAIAHVRGGGEMGRQWYEAGKLANKPNTFSDFVSCAEHLIERGYTAPDRLAIRGGSAGGLLIGATLNLRPDLFAVAVAEVPFVDVLTTILDETLPLTVFEWEEWGNPNDADAYRWIRSYSPYDNLRPGAYPAMYVTAGINDPRVGYWEPAKWVARLRTLRTDDRPMVLVTELGAGHFGPAGRYESWKKEAEVLAFIVANAAPD